jgi:hypothetical protein
VQPQAQQRVSQRAARDQLKVLGGDRAVGAFGRVVEGEERLAFGGRQRV